MINIKFSLKKILTIGIFILFLGLNVNSVYANDPNCGNFDYNGKHYGGWQRCEILGENCAPPVYPGKCGTLDGQSGSWDGSDARSVIFGTFCKSLYGDSDDNVGSVGLTYFPDSKKPTRKWYCWGSSASGAPFDECSYNYIAPTCSNGATNPPACDNNNSTSEDLCPNIDGTQSTLPSGVKKASAGTETGSCYCDNGGSLPNCTVTTSSASCGNGYRECSSGTTPYSVTCPSMASNQACWKCATPVTDPWGEKAPLCTHTYPPVNGKCSSLIGKCSAGGQGGLTITNNKAEWTCYGQYYGSNEECSIEDNMCPDPSSYPQNDSTTTCLNGGTGELSYTNYATHPSTDYPTQVVYSCNDENKTTNKSQMCVNDNFKYNAECSTVNKDECKVGNLDWNNTSRYHPQRPRIEPVLVDGKDVSINYNDAINYYWGCTGINTGQNIYQTGYALCSIKKDFATCGYLNEKTLPDSDSTNSFIGGLNQKLNYLDKSSTNSSTLLNNKSSQLCSSVNVVLNSVAGPIVKSVGKYISWKCLKPSVEDNKKLGWPIQDYYTGTNPTGETKICGLCEFGYKYDSTKKECIVTPIEDANELVRQSNLETTLTSLRVTPAIVNRGDYCTISAITRNIPTGGNCSLYKTGNEITPYQDKKSDELNIQVEPSYKYVYICKNAGNVVIARSKELFCALNPTIFER